MTISRETRISREIRRIFGEVLRPLSVQDILAILGGVGLEPNKTTVYRQLEKMTSAGELEHVHFEGRGLGYELKRDHHHHLICKSCEKIEDLFIKNEEQVLKGILNQKGFKAEDHHLEVFGLCRECK